MIYFRSFLAGLAASFVAEILILIAGLSILLIIAAGRQPSGNDFVFVGWDPVAFARTAPGWIIVVLAFVVGFWWEYRRASAR